MNVRSFLYRRLCRWVTCSFELWPGGNLAIDSKFDRSSFADVFCDPFYWQVFDWTVPVPRLVVDCGAHCGHFTLMTEKCLRWRHGKETETKYILVEPNPNLIAVLQKNVASAGLGDRVSVKHNLVGKKSGTGTLWVQPKNYLTASVNQLSGGKPHQVGYLDLETATAGQTIDLMKIDIEGGEFELVRSNPELFKRVRTIFMELHSGQPGEREELIERLKNAGLLPRGEPLTVHGYELIIFERASTGGT
jgi:FkbM family methyltransferase